MLIKASSVVILYCKFRSRKFGLIYSRVIAWNSADGATAPQERLWAKQTLSTGRSIISCCCSDGLQTFLHVIELAN